METIFISATFLVAVLFFLSQSLSKGVGTVGGALKQVGLFILRKNPPAWWTSSTTETAADPARG